MRFAGRVFQILSAIVVLSTIVFLAVTYNTAPDSGRPLMLAASASLLAILALLLKILGGMGITRGFYLTFAVMILGVVTGVVISLEGNTSSPVPAIILSGVTFILSGLTVLEDFQKRRIEQLPYNGGFVIKLAVMASIIALVVVAFIVLTNLNWANG